MKRVCPRHVGTAGQQMHTDYELYNSSKLTFFEEWHNEFDNISISEFVYEVLNNKRWNSILLNFYHFTEALDTDLNH